MDKVYDFDWFVHEIDNLLVLKISDGKKSLGVYQASEILSIDLDKVEVKFANTLDLTNFISNSVLRFVHVSNPKNVIDIPIRYLYTLLLNSNELGNSVDKSIKISDLHAFTIWNEEIANDGYFVYAYKINEESEELGEIIKIAYDFNDLGMQEKFDALNKVNLINYHMMEDKEVYKK